MRRFANILIILAANIIIWFSLAATADPNSYDLTPVYMGAVGSYEPLAYYPVAVAHGPNGVYSVDPHYKEVQLLDASGLVTERFTYQDRWPRDIEVDMDGNVFLADAANKIRKYDMQGNILAEIGFSGSAPGGFNYLQAIALDLNNGDIYAADRETQLSVFDSTGNLLWNNMATVSSTGRLLNPQGIDRDAAGNIYVADVGRNQIVIFDSDGNYLREIGPTGNGWKIQSPVGVAVGSDDAIYVLNRLQNSSQIGEDQILKFSNSGTSISSWGAKGRAPGELWEQQGIVLAADETIWVAGYQGHNIVHYDTQGNLIEEWNDHNVQPGKFAQVRGAVVGKDAKLYVTDFWNQLVQVFDRYGQFLFMWGERGQKDGQFFNFPRFTAMNDAGQIYVSDDREVRVFDGDGTFVGRSDWIIFPGGIHVDNDGNVWVTSYGESTIRKYTSSLQLLEKFDGSNIPGGLNGPYGIEQGPNGSLYVADTFNHRIVRVATDGAFELEFGSQGNTPGKFAAPVGLATDSEGHLFVSETWSKRIQVFSPTGDYLAGWSVPGQADKDVAQVYELTMDGDYFLYAPDHTRGQAEVHKYALVPTVTTTSKPAYTAGQDLGFLIWSDDGATWHVRWSSDGVPHTFSGVISSTVPVTTLTEEGLEQGDMVQLTSASRIDFSTQDATGEDGVDILVGDAGVITFDLKVDGVESANLVTVGAGAFSPTTLPLPLRTASAPISIDQEGKPDYQGGTDFGYFIWQDSDDGEWHIRWSGDGLSTFNFSGLISSTGGFSNVRTFRFGSNDALSLGADMLSFDAFAGAGQDGLDFFVPEGETVTFDLVVDGNSLDGSIHIGEAATVTSESTVVLVSQAPQGVSGGGLENLATIGSPAYVPAQDAGYFLWQDDDGEWHVRWSGDSITTFQYEGIISSTLPISNVRQHSFEGNDSVSASASELKFNCFAGAGEDGLDFFVPEGARVSFSLLSNQDSSVTDTYIGGLAENPSVMPFTLLAASTSITTSDKPVYVPAQDAGYFLWQDQDDGEWHLRWSGDSISTFMYEGSISSSGGISAFTPFSYEGNDQVNALLSGIGFSGFAGAGQDGLDFFVSAGSQLIFDLKVDGAAQPSVVFIGAQNTVPSTMPFSLYSP